MDKEHILKLAEFENDILELLDHQDELTRSDLQGGVMAVVRKIYRAGQIDNQTRLSIKALVDYLYEDEHRHWQECNRPKEHIYRHVVRVSDWLGKITTDSPDDSR